MAVRGQRRLGQDVTGGQGLPVRYTDAEAALDVAAFLEEITEADLRAHYDPPRMLAAGVYKMPAEASAGADAGEAEFRHLLGHFLGLRALYAEAVEHAEGVLVCLD